VRNRILAGGFLFLLLWAGSSSGQTPASSATSVPSIAALRTTARIVVDGHLDEPDWQTAQPATDFTQRDPDEGKPATERTEIRILYDDNAVYVGARMFDHEPSRIARRLTRRDADPGGIADFIIVGFDPHHDHLTGVYFEVSAAGSLRDAVMFNDSDEDGSWDGVWDAAVSIDDRGWTAEMRIPLSQLRFSAADHQTWGLNAVRYIQRRNEEDWWAFIPKKESAIISKCGHLMGLDGVRGRRHLDLLPYGRATADTNATAQPGDPFTHGTARTGGIGLDVKWGVTSNMTVDAAVNPDFGQVEVDPAVVNLTAFETFFDEKRPFFIEGSESFQNFGGNGPSEHYGFNRANPTLFYSRRIGRPPQGHADGDFVDQPSASTILGAAKLTGKTASRWTINVIDAVTSREWAKTADGTMRGRVEVEPLTNYMAARVRRDIGTRAGLGMLTTLVARDLRTPDLQSRLGAEAFIVGGDGYLFLDSGRDYVVAGAFSGSVVSGSSDVISRLERSSARYFQRPDASHLVFNPTARSLSGWNLQLDFNRNTGDLRPNASFWAVSPGYEVNDIGFMSTADRSGMHAVLTWRKPRPDRFSRDRQLVVAKWYTWNFAREKTSDGIFAGAGVMFRNYWSASASLVGFFGGYDDRLTRGGPMMWSPAGTSYAASIGSDNRKPVVLSLGGDYGASVSGSWSGGATATVTLKPTPSLSITAGPSISRGLTAAQYVSSVRDAAAVATYGARYVFGEIGQTELSMTTRANLIFTPRVSLQIYAQPLLSVGRYSGFKEAAKPRTFSFNRYGVDVGSIAFDPAAGSYTVNPSAAGSSPFSFPNPDFNFKSLRVNSVFRWEFKPGSTLFLVWTQQREDYARPGRFDFSADVSSLMRAPADNVVMVKLSYWFTR